MSISNELSKSYDSRTGKVNPVAAEIERFQEAMARLDSAIEDDNWFEIAKIICIEPLGGEKQL